MNTLRLLVLAAVCLAGSLSFATERKFESGPLMFDQPETWKQLKSDPAELKMISADKKMHLRFLAIPSKHNKLALRLIMNDLSKRFKDIQVARRIESSVNDIPAILVDFLGKDGESPIAVSMVALQTGDATVTLISAFIEPSEWKRQRKVFMKMVNSIRKADPPALARK